MERAPLAYGLCRRTFTSTWEPRPHVVMWIHVYAATIRPMFAYTSIVWFVKATSVNAKNYISGYCYKQAYGPALEPSSLRFMENNGREDTEHWKGYLTEGMKSSSNVRKTRMNQKNALKFPTLMAQRQNGVLE